MKVKTGCELETLLMNQHNFFLFQHPTTPDVIYLSSLIPSPRVTLTHARLHMANNEILTRACFPETSHIKTKLHIFQHTELFNTVFGQRLSFSHICNLSPLIQRIRICNSFILNYACFCLQPCCCCFFVLTSQMNSFFLICVCLQIHSVTCFHCKFRLKFLVVKNRLKGDTLNHIYNKMPTYAPQRQLMYLSSNMYIL